MLVLVRVSVSTNAKTSNSVSGDEPGEAALQRRERVQETAGCAGVVLESRDID